MEYVIAVDYIIDKNELSWSRGYYYTDYKKAQLDFNRVKSGQYLIPVHKEADAR